MGENEGWQDVFWMLSSPPKFTSSPKTSEIQMFAVDEGRHKGKMPPVIQSFADKSTEALWNGGRHKIPSEIATRALFRLEAIHNAPTLESLRNPTSNHLEILSGDRAGQHSIRINQRYRVCFVWDSSNDAHDVEIADYH